MHSGPDSKVWSVNSEITTVNVVGALLAVLEKGVCHSGGLRDLCLVCVWHRLERRQL